MFQTWKRSVENRTWGVTKRKSATKASVEIYQIFVALLR